MILFPLLMGFCIAAFGGFFLIPLLRKMKFGQQVRRQGPKRHYLKTGTPTMGGLIFLISVALTVLVFSQRDHRIFIVLLSTFGFGLIGFIDDFIKIALKRPLGLRATHKIIVQILLATFISYYAFAMYPDVSKMAVPFSNMTLDLGLMFVPFSVFVFIGSVNSVNLTDGLDGLLAGIAIIVLAAYAAICFTLQYSNLVVFCLGFIGGLLGFLLYNKYPASVFMGDTGSFAIGGAISGLAVLTKTQLFLPLIGFVFVVEALSVIIQVFFYRIFGKRVFKMSPIHHHFELSGLNEPQVVFGFWCVAFAAALLGLFAFYM